MKLTETLKNYFSIRKCVDDAFFKGKMTSDPSLIDLQKAIDEFYWPLKEMSQIDGLSWKIQIGFGKGNATADQYVALIPPGQKVSEGIFFCICFDHCGTGCVMGAMTAIQKKPKINVPLIQRAAFVPNAESQLSWQMIPPNTVDVRKWNNAFFYFEELGFDEILESESLATKKITDCFEKSLIHIKDLLPKK